MEESKKLKLCICYSHCDEDKITELTKHLAILEHTGLIDTWYDRKIIPGQYFQETIDNNLENADIICLSVSANFYFSKECIAEKIKALNIRKRKGISVVPIILSECGWSGDKDISTILALPTDGKPVSQFPNSDAAWSDVCSGLKHIIEKETKIRELKITAKFNSFLNNTEFFTKAHSLKTEVFLEDIFVYPELEKYDDLGEYETKVSSERLVEDFSECSKIIIGGEEQSGKTTLSKKMFVELRKRNFVPIYISNITKQTQGQIGSRIKKEFKEQYGSDLFEEIDKERIVPIIDDFHFTKKKEQHILDLSPYCHQIVIVDDIFGLSLKDENLIKSFNQFKIKEFIPSLRNTLIEKWITLNDKNSASNRENEKQKGIDAKTELVNTTLGKVFSSGIMPAYPFFILSIISTHETLTKPLEITSQGYCYQALIFLYLRKQGVKNDEIETYINFLTEFAFYVYAGKKQELPETDFDLFMTKYLKEFNLPIRKEILLRNLQNSRIIFVDSCNNYSFHYPYFYYFFIAKYLADNLSDNLEKIDLIINNLHNNENAYIAIFMTHHSQNNYILDEIIVNAMCLFSKYKSATLTKGELNFFDLRLDNIVKAVLPPRNCFPKQGREENLRQQDLNERNNDSESNAKTSKVEEDDDSLAKELRRSIKTVEVMGSIIKNRAGSLGRGKLENVFEEAMKVHLRMLSSFFELIGNENAERDIVGFISNRLGSIIKDEKREPDQQELEKLSIRIFWGLNFGVIYGIINKTIHSLGSEKLLAIVEKVCDKVDTPASFLVKHGIFMWYNKNLQIDTIADRIEENDFAKTTKRIMKFMVVNHCALHLIDYKGRQKIEDKLKISSVHLKQPLNK